MKGLYDELSDKVQQAPKLTKPGMARVDLGLLLFNAGDALRKLWLAADAELDAAQQEGHSPSPRLAAAVERLRPISRSSVYAQPASRAFSTTIQALKPVA